MIIKLCTETLNLQIYFIAKGSPKLGTSMYRVHLTPLSTLPKLELLITLRLKYGKDRNILITVIFGL